MEIEGYQAKIKITTAFPVDEKYGPFPESQVQQKILIDQSWMCNPFGDQTTYGVEFLLNRGFSWTFLLFEESELAANEMGGALLFNLKEKFLGLNGKIEIIPLYSSFLDIERPIYEIFFPYKVITKIFILRKILNLHKSRPEGVNLNVYIFWQKDNLNLKALPDEFMIKIFVNLRFYGPLSTDLNAQENTRKAILKYLTTDIGNAIGKKIKYEKPNSDSWRKILTCNPFYYNFDNSPLIAIPEKLRPGFVSSANIDLTIPRNFPLLKPPILKNYNDKCLPISEFDENYLYIGKKIIDGIYSNMKALIKMDSLSQHLFIFGHTGTGKSTLLKKIVNEIHTKKPDVGILILNLAKPDQEFFFPMAKVIKFPSKEARFPYFSKGERIKKAIKETSNYIAACLGLKYVGPVIISETLQRCYKEFNDVPKSILELFEHVKKNLKAKPYAPEFQNNILMAFEHRVNELLNNPEIEEALQLYANEHELPEWFKIWRNGGVIFLDLVQLDEKECYLITMAIFQMIQNLTPYDEANELKHIIAIDEAHRIAAQSKDRDPDSVEFIMKSRSESYFSKLIEEYRSRGTGIIISDTIPRRLYESAQDSAGNKIIFRLPAYNNDIFTNDIEEQQLLLNLEDYDALVLNDTEAQRYLIKTLK